MYILKAYSLLLFMTNSKLGIYIFIFFFFEDLIDLIERFMMGQHPIEQLEGQSDL